MYYTIETTSSRIGHPSDLQKAVIGFATYEEAERYAEKHNMSVRSFFRKDGWNLWARDRHTFQAFQLHASDFSEDYQHYNWNEADQYWRDVNAEAEERLEFDGWTQSQAFEYLAKCEKVRNEIAKLKEGQFACVYNNEVCEVHERETMEYHHDGTTYAIGCV